MNILDQFKLNDKVALVTGCTRGIGKSITLALAEAGAAIIGVSKNLNPNGSDLETQVNAIGRKFTGYSCDFADRGSLNDLISSLRKNHIKIDILINNAGMISRDPIIAHSDEAWDQVIAVNQTSQFILSREIGKDMVARGSGKIVFIASLLTFQGGVTVPGYAASKGAIGQLTKAFANEWAELGVNVNAIAPGYIKTDNTSALRDDKTRAQSILDRIPAGRWGEPEDIAGATVFLSSPASDYIHGTIMTVDGGWMGR